MRFFLNEVLVQLKGIWNRLDGGQRLVVSAVMLATLVGLGAIFWFAAQPSYETVFDAKTNEEIAQFKQTMQTAGVSFKVDDSGRSFRVERAKIGLAKMALGEAGLNGGSSASTVGGGLSLIEDSETKAWKLDAASRAQAAAAIQALDGVQSVTVTASRPRRTAAFRDRDSENKSSATVLLRLKPGAAFEPLARSAASLASSQLMVPLENIEIVSAAGNQRWKHDPDREAGGGSSDFLNMQRGMSDNRTRMAQERLDQMWPGKTSVSVSLELDPLWEVRNEKVVPTEQVVKSEKTSKDSTDSAGAKSDDGKNTSKNETKDREFVTEIGERRTGRLAPDIKRLTVAVLYDRSLEKTTNFNKEDLVNAVKAIVGWNPERDKPEAFSTLVGDFVPIEPDVAGSSGPGMADLLLRWGPTIGQILGVLVVVLFLRGLFKRSSKAATSSSMSSSTSSGSGASAQVNEEDLPPEEQQKRMRREIERSIASDPAGLAKMLEAWLTEQKA
ncbi:MAG: flagellar M-ring protein FliF C-terminal domain-containing protein [Planctomycetota bacterium]